MRDYDNTAGILEQIPDSPHFTYKRQAETGLTIRSKENSLILEIDPLVKQLSESKEKRTQAWGVEVESRGANDSVTGKLSQCQVSRKNTGNWVVDGFAMTVVKGELLRNGEVIPVFGFAELIK